MRSRLRRLAVAAPLAAGLSATGAALAQGVPQSFGECSAIAADSDRLACYDRASGRASIAPPAPAAQAPASDEKLAPPAGTPSAATSMIDAAWGFDPASPKFSVDFYNPNYLLLARYSNNLNNQPYSPRFPAANAPQQGISSTEAKFQISFKARLWTTDDRRWGLWGAYTQQSLWQLYDAQLSRPFRDTNYIPELFVSYRPGLEVAGMHWRLLNVGYNHESNGQGDILSRSWNRIFAEVGVEKDSFALLARAWYSIKEPAGKSDNPDITDYYGYGSLKAIYRWHNHSFALMGRGNISTGKGAGQFTWTTPKLFGPLRGYVQVFSGYGESLIDYNWHQTTLGIGFAFNDSL